MTIRSVVPGCCCPSDGGQCWGKYCLPSVVAQLQGLPNQFILSTCCELHFFCTVDCILFKLTRSPWKGQHLSTANSNWRVHCRRCCNAALFTLTRSPLVSNVSSKGRTCSFEWVDSCYIKTWTLFNDKYIVNLLAMGISLSNCLKQNCMKIVNSHYFWF